MKKTVKVVAAIIENENNEILCALRSPSMSIPNMWEFPGGKVEAQEFFNEHTHEYDAFTINLIAIKCKVIEGSPSRSEHAKLIWLKRENLSSLKWAPADIPAVDQLINEKI